MSSMKNGLPLLLIVIAAACLHSEAVYLPRTFHEVNLHFTWDDARAYCRANFTDLATIRSLQELANLPQCSSGSCWLGLYRDADNVWKWSGGDNLTFVDWYSEYFLSYENCAALYQLVGKYVSKDCGTRRPFFCYKERLFLVKEKKTWEEALEHCRSHFRDLASVLTNEDFSYAQNVTQYAQTDQVWTAQRYLGSKWWWVNGDQMQNQDLPVCPAQDRLCGTLPKTGNALATENCEERRNFLCYAN